MDLLHFRQNFPAKDRSAGIFQILYLGHKIVTIVLFFCFFLKTLALKSVQVFNECHMSHCGTACFVYFLILFLISGRTNGFKDTICRILSGYRPAGGS